LGKGKRVQGIQSKKQEEIILTINGNVIELWKKIPMLQYKRSENRQLNKKPKEEAWKRQYAK
jgi:hypothetical protein